MSETYYNSDASVVTHERLQWMFDEWFVLSGLINIGDWIPWLSWFDLQGFVKRMKALRKNMTEFYEYVLEITRQRGKHRRIIVQRIWLMLCYTLLMTLILMP